MADAQKLVVEVPVQVYQKVTTINLELSEDEAKALGYILGNIAGSVVNTLRRHTEAVRLALADVGFKHYVEDTGEFYEYIDGTIYFTPDSSLDADND